MQLYDHQLKTVEFLHKRHKAYIGSDPGTGKTASVLKFLESLPKTERKRALIVAPKSILKPSWYDDIQKFTPGLTATIAYAGAFRSKAFSSDSDIVIINHDGIKYVAENKKMLKDFNFICVDEATAFKNKNSLRTKALLSIRFYFGYRIAMSGTMTPQSVLDLWAQMYFVDDGETLGKSLFNFKQQVCTPMPVPGVPGATQWVDKPDAPIRLANYIKDVCIRFKKEECLSLPDNIQHTIKYTLNPKHQKMYEKLKDEFLLELESSDITAVHAGVLANKLLQLISGAVYDSQGKAHVVDKDRTHLVMDLIEARTHSVVAFNWQHQKEQLVQAAINRNIKYGVIDGTVGINERNRVVDNFQAGLLQVVFAHPQSAGHGLTLTRGEATIWSSPTHNAEHFEQFNARVYRAGQTKKTETILIAAENTYEELVYKNLTNKVGRMSSLLELLKQLNKGLKR